MSSSQNTFNFCLQFIKDNVNEASQRTMCRTWLKTAITTLDDAKLSSSGFMINELEAIDTFFSGANGSMTSNDVMSKLQTVKQIGETSEW